MTKNTRFKHKAQKGTDDFTIDRLNQEIRELKSLNRSLMKRLKKIDREYYEALENTEEDDEIESAKFESETLKAIQCPDCNKGVLTVTTLAGRQFSRCNMCDYRSKAKKL